MLRRCPSRAKSWKPRVYRLREFVPEDVDTLALILMMPRP